MHVYMLANAIASYFEPCSGDVIDSSFEACGNNPRPPNMSGNGSVVQYSEIIDSLTFLNPDLDVTWVVYIRFYADLADG